MNPCQVILGIVSNICQFHWVTNLTEGLLPYKTVKTCHGLGKYLTWMFVSGKCRHVSTSHTKRRLVGRTASLVPEESKYFICVCILSHIYVGLVFIDAVQYRNGLNYISLPFITHHIPSSYLQRNSFQNPNSTTLTCCYFSHIRRALLLEVFFLQTWTSYLKGFQLAGLNTI